MSNTEEHLFTATNTISIYSVWILCVVGMGKFWIWRSLTDLYSFLLRSYWSICSANKHDRFFPILFSFDSDILLSISNRCGRLVTISTRTTFTCTRIQCRQTGDGMCTLDCHFLLLFIRSALRQIWARNVCENCTFRFHEVKHYLWQTIISQVIITCVQPNKQQL